MKHFMQPRSRILKENHAEGTQTPSPDPIRQRLPSFSSRKQKSSKENAPPLDLNCAHEIFSSPTGKPLPPSTGKLKSPLPPRPPSSNSNPLKRKLNMDTVVDCANPGSSDSGVKVVVRMRPPIKDDEGETVVQKVAGDSLSILGQPFTFDSVADTGSTQLDMFELVGAPLVENCLAGFNSSVFAYGQTGSGKTYTMWGPANALLEENALDDRQGLTPRVLERLFARINEEQIRHADKQLKYQCRCSFLEIYNEQITDLLEPTQRNLQIREDVKSGVYVENLTEECIFTMKDVAQLLTKGLLNRRTGATSKNAESSRSHSVFTCIVESRCKSTADGISSFKTSRINLVDLAGSERQKLTGAAGERLKEAKNINRSLSQLGNLINILAEVSQTGKQRHIPYRDSRLTFLLQESLGGNAKLAMVCAISPAQSCKSETLSTLRFAQRAKAIKNKAVVNEIMQDDVNFLRKVIRQLKEELLRVKAGNPIDANSDYSTGWIARRSYHLLKFSLSRPTALPHDDNDSDEDMEIDEDAVEKVCAEVGIQSTCSEERRSTSYSGQREIVQLNSEGISEDAPGEDDSNNNMDVNMEEGTPEPPKLHESMRASCVEEGQLGDGATCHPPESEYGVHDGVSVLDSPSAVPCEGSPVLRSPTPSVSPEVSNSCRKVLRTSLVASLKDLEDNSGMSPGTFHMSFAKFAKDSSSSKKSHPPAELLAASLHRGLEIIENYRQNSPLGRSFRSSLNTFKPVFPVQKVEVGVQTVEVGVQTVLQAEDRVELLCSKCRIPKSQSEESDGSSNLQLVLVDGSHSDGKSMKQVPKAVEKVLAGAIRREMALEEVCAKQTSEIMHLNRLAQQYIHERECNAIIGQMREDKILRLESLMDGVLPAEDFMEEELASLTNEHKLLNEKYENHPDVLQTKIELKRALDECEQYQTFFDLGEREVLMEEIRDLRSHLQSYVDPSSSTLAQKRSSSPLLTKPSCDPCLASPPLSTVPESFLESMEDKLEQERAHWTEAESKWISLAEELRIELESSRCLAEKLKRGLDSVKKHADMIVYARVLDQQADLEVKHMELLARYRRIKEGIDDVKKAAQKAGVRGAESKFINALAAEISVLKLEREKERRYLRDENKGLQAQLQDTAEAVQAAGELLVRLKEAEEAAAGAQRRVVEAKQETDKAYKQIDRLKRKHEKVSATFNLEESRYPQEESLRPANPDSSKFDMGDQQWKEEFEPFFEGGDDELSKLAETSSWFAGYDRCNI